MILDKLLELEAHLERERTEAFNMTSEKFEEYRSWREHTEKLTHELKDLKEIIRNAQTPKKYPE